MERVQDDLEDQEKADVDQCDSRLCVFHRTDGWHKSDWVDITQETVTHEGRTYRRKLINHQMHDYDLTPSTYEYFEEWR